MIEYYLLADDGKTPVQTTELLEVEKLLRDKEKRKVAHTEIDKDCHVSTVFLCIDHGWNGEVALFETMVFGGPHDGWMDRYATWDEAVEGHAKVVRQINSGELPG